MGHEMKNLKSKQFGCTAVDTVWGPWYLCSVWWPGMFMTIMMLKQKHAYM